MHALEVALTPKLGAAAPLLLDNAVEHVLGGDGGVIDTREPEGGSTLHARAAHHQIFERDEECVAHMQSASDVGWRHDDRERWE